MNTTTVGVDLAKYTFSVCMMDSQGRMQLRREFRGDALAVCMAQLPRNAV